jgi:hypothetical protein
VNQCGQVRLAKMAKEVATMVEVPMTTAVLLKVE